MGQFSQIGTFLATLLLQIFSFFKGWHQAEKHWLHGSSYLWSVGSCSSGGQPRHGSHALEGGNWPFDLFRIFHRGSFFFFFFLGGGGRIPDDCEPFGFDIRTLDQIWVKLKLEILAYHNLGLSKWQLLFDSHDHSWRRCLLRTQHMLTYSEFIAGKLVHIHMMKELVKRS